MSTSEMAPAWVVNWSTDCAAQCQHIDPQWEEITGQPALSALGDGWLQVIHPDDREVTKAELGFAGKQTRPFRIIAKLKRAEGDFRWAMAVGAPQHDELGAFIGFRGSIIDLHDRVVAKQESDRHSADMQKLQAISGRLLEQEDAGSLYDEIVQASISVMRSDAASLQLFGPEKHELRLLASSGLHPDSVAYWSTVSTDSGSCCGAALKRAQRLVVPDVAQAEFANETETLRHWRLNGIEAVQATPLFARDGRLIGMIATHWRRPHQPSETEFALFDLLARQAADLLERQRTIDALQQSEARFRALTLASSNMVYRMSPDWSELRDLVGRDLDHDAFEPRQNWLERHIVSEDRSHVREAIDDAIRAKGVFDLEHRVVRADGSIGWTHSRAIPILDASNEISEWFGAAHDITERKQAQGKLQQREALLKAVLDQSADAIFVKDREGRLILANPATYAAIGKPAEDCIGKTAVEFLENPEDGRAIMVNDRRIMETGQAEVLEETLDKTSGARCYLNSKAPYRDSAGNITGLIGTARDITEFKKAEAALRKSEASFRKIFSNNMIPMAIRNASGRIADANDAFLDLIGYRRVELDAGEIGWAEITPQAHRARDAESFADLARQGFVQPYEQAYRHKDGRLIPVLIGGGTFSDDETAILFAIDLTERKRADEALRWRNRANALLSETASRLLGSDDPQRLVEELCQKVMEFLDCDVFFNFLVDEPTGRLRLNACGGVTAENARQAEWLDFGVAVCGCVARDAQRILAENIRQSNDPRVELIRSFGVQAYCCHPLLIEGRSIGTLSFGVRSRAHLEADSIEVMKGVADLVAVAMRRIETERALREADRRKDDFIATLAHELRNPLTPIKNAVHVLRRTQTPDAALLDMAQRQVEHLVRLVDELLEISRITRGKIELRKESVAVSDFLRDALEVCQPLVEKRRHSVTVKIANDRLHALGDPVRLAQIAANIINNAVKYTPPGGRIWIEAVREDGMVALRVRDNGVGVSGAMMPRIFDLFAQSEGQMLHAEGGLGIGLALERKLVDLHGGRVAAKSDGVGKGSEFAVWLPCDERATAAAPEQEMLDAVGGRNSRALVIDDDRDVADSFALLLETLGATVHKTYDGSTGVAAIDAFEPDLIFVDIGMPDVDGYETARRIRQRVAASPYRLVALSGWGQDSDRRRALEAGFDLHLTKPAPIETIEALLREAQSSPRPDRQMV
jgi:PAS domain S-box-containing protein